LQKISARRRQGCRAELRPPASPSATARGAADIAARLAQPQTAPETNAVIVNDAMPEDAGIAVLTAPERVTPA